MISKYYLRNKKKLDRAAKNTALSFYYSLPGGLVL